MRPDFGAGLSAFVFEPMTPTTLEALRQRVQEALVDWEPRIDVEKVTVTAVPDEGKVLIDMAYRVRATNSAPEPRVSVLPRRRVGAVIVKPAVQIDGRDARELLAELLERRAGYTPEWLAADKTAGAGLAAVGARYSRPSSSGSTRRRARARWHFSTWRA